MEIMIKSFICHCSAITIYYINSRKREYRSVGVGRCFLEKVGDRFGLGVYTCSLNATVQLP